MRKPLVLSLNSSMRRRTLVAQEETVRIQSGQTTKRERETAAAVTAPTQKVNSLLQPPKTPLPAQGPTAVQRGGVTDAHRGPPAASSGSAAPPLPQRRKKATNRTANDEIHA